MNITEFIHTLQNALASQTFSTKLWHAEQPHAESPNPSTPSSIQKFQQLVLIQHLSNFKLWHVEDTARRRDVDPSVIANCKYQIDSYNQERNDYMEQIDTCFIDLITPLLPSTTNATINTESPGMAIDRASILSLKIWHMKEQFDRTDVSQKHIHCCQQKLTILQEQRADLTDALIFLIHEYHTGSKKPKCYFQHKMYNDPMLNPELYSTKN